MAGDQPLQPDGSRRVDGRPEIIDWKSATRAYAENFYQLAAYKAMLIETGRPVEAVRVVVLGREASTQFPFDEVVPSGEDADRHWFTFWAIRLVYLLSQTKQPLPAA